jgi:CheY-like chemotaxis protein
MARREKRTWEIKDMMRTLCFWGITARKAADREIRTPLNAVIGFTQLLKETSLTPQQGTYLNKVCVSTRDLKKTIDDILDFSKIEAGHMSLEQVRFTLPDLLENLSGTLAGVSTDKGLKLTFDVEAGLPHAFVGDPLRLGQVLRNLGSNALKFTPSGEVKLSVGCLPAPAGMARLRFQVADTGIGMTPEERSRIFLPFTQADDSTTRRFGGTGLGLAITRQLVELMGGRIEVKSQPGHGSTFSFALTLMVADTPAGEPETGPSEPPLTGATVLLALAGTTVLLAEDNTFNQELFKEILERAGAKVTLVGDGAQAVEQVRSGAFDAVLMDLQMPVMGGYEAVREIRKDLRDASLPIIAITAHALGGGPGKGPGRGDGRLPHQAHRPGPPAANPGQASPEGPGPFVSGRLGVGGRRGEGRGAAPVRG